MRWCSHVPPRLCFRVFTSMVVISVFYIPGGKTPILELSAPRVPENTLEVDGPFVLVLGKIKLCSHLGKLKTENINRVTES